MYEFTTYPRTRFKTTNVSSHKKLWLDGGTGNNVLRGEAGRDRLFGPNGRNRIYTGAGRDNIDGGRNRLAQAGRTIFGRFISAISTGIRRR
jgi:Ca2+-binding RTX toxin-like protein